MRQIQVVIGILFLAVLAGGSAVQAGSGTMIGPGGRYIATTLSGPNAGSSIGVNIADSGSGNTRRFIRDDGGEGLIAQEPDEPRKWYIYIEVTIEGRHKVYTKVGQIIFSPDCDGGVWEDETNGNSGNLRRPPAQ